MLSPRETAYLEKINELIGSRLTPPNNILATTFVSDLDATCRHLCLSVHGKRARPLLCLYYHWMLSPDIAHNFAQVGVAAEFIHAASLLHDDIIDEAEKRRGTISANCLFGNKTAVLAGDYLLTEAFELLRPFDRALIDRAILVVREMTKASILELNIRGRVDINLEILRSIAKGKTGNLFAWCGFAAGILCDNEAVATKFFDLGERIGLIFQLADDLKDFDGDNSLKDVCRDIYNKEMSVPILLATELSQSIRERFEKAFQNELVNEQTVAELKDSVMNSGAVEKARKMMSLEVDYVLSALHPFNGTLGKTGLENFVAELCLP
jgi:heptaprenyl diphosphate synthase